MRRGETDISVRRIPLKCPAAQTAQLASLRITRDHSHADYNIHSFGGKSSYILVIKEIPNLLMILIHFVNIKQIRFNDSRRVNLAYLPVRSSHA